MFPEPENNRTRLFLAVFLGLAAVFILLLLLFKPMRFGFFSDPKPLDVVRTDGVVQEGDNMAVLLARHKIPNDVSNKIQNTISKSFNLRRMLPKDTYEIQTTTTGVFLGFIYNDTDTHFYSIARSSTGVYSIEETTKSTTRSEVVVQADINTFLYNDLLKSGLTDSFVNWFTNNLADNIFAWRIDFFTEQRPGDHLVALVERQTIEGTNKPIYGGTVLVASYTGKGTRQKENIAIRYRIPGSKKDDYFDGNGNAVRKAFLRAPFTYGNFRVSSGYNPKRLHPILRTYRPHHGTDYAAARGTPVASIGKGQVIFAGWKGGYGNCVEVRHTPKYTSRYGHLSKIGVRYGQAISQGQYIGNVGSTGLSTGPHLHFEMLVDGSQRNFLRMDFPSAASIPKEHLSDFNRVRDELLGRLNQKLAQEKAPTTKGNT